MKNFQARVQCTKRFALHILNGIERFFYEIIKLLIETILDSFIFTRLLSEQLSTGHVHKLNAK